MYMYCISFAKFTFGSVFAFDRFGGQFVRVESCIWGEGGREGDFNEGVNQRFGTIYGGRGHKNVTWCVVLGSATMARARTAVANRADICGARGRSKRRRAERTGDDRGKRYNRRYLDGGGNCTVAAAASGFLTTLTTSLARLSLALPAASLRAIV